MPSNSYPMSQAVRAAYRAGQEDETLEPLVRVDGEGRPVGSIQDGDAVIFYDIRGEREVELTSAFVDDEFPHFCRPEMKVSFATMIEYHPDLEVQVAFPPLAAVEGTLSEVVSRSGQRQAKVVESEKGIHVSFFLNGKALDPFPGEERVVIPSPRPEVHAEMPPEMSAAAVAEAAIAAIEDEGNALVTVNLANVDVIGHIENPDAIRRAVETVDVQAGRIVDAARAAGMTAVVTADHGTVERWYYPDGTIDTGHTDSPVPFFLVDPALGRQVALRPGGSLIDVAPTILQLLNLEKPAGMTGESLIVSPPPVPPQRGGEKKRVLLLILDGWGMGDRSAADLIAQAHTPRMDELQATWPSTRLAASGLAVGMPPGTVGNSEAGHLHIGAGRIVPADRVRISQALADGSFYENEAFLWAMRQAKERGTRLHLLGIVSFYSSHGSVDHLMALMEMARREGVPEVYVHSMLGRRGERPESGAIYIEQVEREAERLGVGRLATVIGRFWSLDREEHWDRIEKTYRMLVHGEGKAVAEV
ncbi:MAG: phosphoglycerate mutase (2,3-diphosphoglycerate-independent) [Anaerolineae bacterium]|nr:phosphoglycerate mutase (2,3-diphosphoglycerate-independent) [Anaerolineae bacterium]